MMAKWIFVFGIVGFLWQASGDNKYDNYTLLRIYPQTEEKAEQLVGFTDPTGDVEMLKGSRGVNDSMDVLVPLRRMNFMMDIASEADVMYDKQDNYGRNFETDDRTPRRRAMKSFNLFSFHPYQAMLEYVRGVAAAHPDLVTLQYPGNSYQGRPLVLVKISANPAANNPIIFVDAGIHAREWVAPSMALYLIHRLTSPEARTQEVNGVDWYILPLVNPDGYEFSRSSPSNRLWRKTRSKTGRCYGVDGNRNYEFKWGVSGVSNNPCDPQTYAGPYPFSEPETQAVRDIMINNANNTKLYVSIHSYGQYLVYPWGYTRDYLPSQWKKLDALAKKVSAAVVRAGGPSFKVMSAGKWYPAAGGSDDYAFGAIGVPYSYTMEVTDGYEFTYPEYLLETSLPRLYEGFKSFGLNIRNEFGRTPETGRIPFTSLTFFKLPLV